MGWRCDLIAMTIAKNRLHFFSRAFDKTRRCYKVLAETMPYLFIYLFIYLIRFSPSIDESEQIRCYCDKERWLQNLLQIWAIICHNM